MQPVSYNKLNNNVVVFQYMADNYITFTVGDKTTDIKLVWSRLPRLNWDAVSVKVWLLTSSFYKVLVCESK